MRLLTYNIHKGVGGRDRRYDLSRVIGVIEEENPDLILLQEVTRDAPRSRHDDQPKLLAEYFKAEGHLYQQNVRYQRGGYGNLLLSRWPLDAHHHISLRLRAKKPRGAQIAVVKTPEGPLSVVNCHLGLAERERHWQVDHLLSHALFRECGELPTVIAGDCNDWRNTLCCGGLANGFRQVSAPVSHFRSFPAWLSMGALDKAFVRGDIDVKHARVVRTRLARRASDHLPLVVDFHLRNGQQNGAVGEPHAGHAPVVRG